MMRKEYSKWMPVSDGNLPGIEGWLDNLAREGFFLKEADGRSWYLEELLTQKTEGGL